MPWETVFSASACRSEWAVTGFHPAMWRVFWQLWDSTEEAKRKQSERTEMATGLNVNNFALNSLAVGRPLARQELENLLENELDCLDDDR